MSGEEQHFQERRNQRVCKFFLETKGCKFGNNCHFYHPAYEDGVLNSTRENPSEQFAEELQSTSDHQTHRDGGLKGKPTYSRGQALKEPRSTYYSSNTVPRYEAVNTDPFSGPNPNRGSLANSEYDTTPGGDFADGPRSTCRFFASSGWCKYGRRCSFAHVREHAERYRREPAGEKWQDRGKGHRRRGRGRQTPKQMMSDESTESNICNSVSNWKGDTVERREKMQFCRYFIAGFCNMGENCKFFHPNSDETLPPLRSNADMVEEHVSNQNIDISTNLSKGSEKPTQKPLKRNPVQRPRGPVMEHALEGLADEDIEKLRQSEIQLLKRRFPKVKSVKEDKIFEYQFSSSDPDWPYDVNEVTLEVTFAPRYPTQRLKVVLLPTEVLPETVRRVVGHNVDDWLQKRFERLQTAGRVELVFRPFMRWLDRSMEDSFTEGLKQYQRELMAKAAGFEFIPAAKLQETYNQSADSEEEGSEDEGSSDEDVGDESVEEEGEDDEDNDNDDDEYGSDYAGELEDEKENKEEGTRHNPADPVRKGTELKLNGLQLKESAGTVLFTKITLILQCGRCKNHTEVSTPMDRVNALQCPRCQNNQLMTFRGSLIHQFTSVMGYLDLHECIPHDIILADCHFTMSCVNCSKDQKVQGLPPGQPKDSWCQRCHQKLRIAAENVKFQQLQPTDTGPRNGQQVHVVSVAKLKKVPKDPAIQEGKPLPDNGTCKHYKKSFRWLRFPCCGKAYPCDICHDAKEFDHEMKYANRMICGYCCREQPFSAEKGCLSCGSNLTNKSTTHWEGGKGCRDVVKMSRDDDRKYANGNKTVSRKAQAKKKPGKKTTKLRHT